MDTLLVGFALGVLGGVLGDIARERLRRVWDRRTLCSELRDDLQLLGELLGNIMDQAKELATAEADLGPVFSDHAKRDLSLARDRFGRLMERLHLVESFAVRRQFREFEHVLHSTTFAVETLDDRSPGLDSPDEVERITVRVRWANDRKGLADQCLQWLEWLKGEAAVLLGVIPDA